MAQTNKVKISGNLTKKPEFKVMDNGKTSCTFSVAVNNNYEKDGQKISESSYFTVKTYGEVAEKMRDAKKGQAFTVSGMYKQRSYEKDGEKRYVSEILAFEADLADKEKKQSAYIEFAGNLASDPEIKTFENGNKKCSFTIINNDEYENKEHEKIKEITPLTVELWNEAIEKVKDGKKGNCFKMEGFLKQNRWIKDGIKYSVIKLQAIDAQKIEKKSPVKEVEPERGM